MNNAFLVIRAIFFALLMYFHVLVLIFASWNIAAAKSFGMSAPGATVFLLMNSILIFVLLPTAYFAELICARARPGHVRVECAWTALMSIFQLAASISVTVNGPPMFCQTNSQWAMCASSSLLVHISWFATLIILSYCLTICIAAVAHATSLPDIWITAVQRVPWFSPKMIETLAPPNTSRLPTDKHARTTSAGSSSSDASCAISRYIAERWEKLSRTEGQSGASGPIIFTRGRQSVDATRPSWARQRRTRRGIDNPFAKPLPRLQLQEQPPVLAPPPRTYSRHVVVTPSLREPRSVGTSTCASPTLVLGTPVVFPQRIADPDLPIPRPGSLSDWVCADALYAEVIPSP